MKRQLWSRLIDETSIPAFPCPRCANGHLSLTKAGVAKAEGAYAKLNRNDPEWEPDMQKVRFSAFLHCNQASCGEIVVIAGGMETVETEIEEVQSWGLVDLLRPQTICPAPPIIDVPAKTPKNVRQALELSFLLYWADTSSSANKLRVSVEALLTHLGIPRYNHPKKGKKRSLLTLDARIQRFGAKLSKALPAGSKHPQETLLHALRWVGNVGSHQGAVDSEVLLHAFEIYEHVLGDLIAKKPQALAGVAAALVASKGLSVTP